MINVLLVEDHELYRMGLSMLLSKAEGITLCAEAADGLEGIKSARAKEMDRANPNTGDGVLQIREALEPDDATVTEPKREFEIDYAQNKKYPQKKGMRIKGAIGESIARHKAAREEGEMVSKKKIQAERRQARRKARKLEASEPKKD